MSVPTWGAMWKSGLGCAAENSFAGVVASGAAANGKRVARSGLAVNLASCLARPVRCLFKVADESDDARGRDDIGGTDARRFGGYLGLDCACGDIEAGNEAEGETSGEDGRRVVQAAERRTSFCGGVGGVDIHVGGDRISLGDNSSEGVLGAVVKSPVLADETSLSSSDSESRPRAREDMLVVGVQTGEAIIEGRGRKPQLVGRLLLDTGSKDVRS